jgi:hypothetical protein
MHRPEEVAAAVDSAVAAAFMAPAFAAVDSAAVACGLWAFAVEGFALRDWVDA